MNVRNGVLIGVACTFLFAALAAFATAAAEPPVALGVHQFGRLSAPESIVARTGPQGVGFECGKPSVCVRQACGSRGGCDGGGTGCGCMDVLPEGPRSFGVAADGSVWLLDQVRNRVLVWRSGRPERPARAIRLPRNIGVFDFALGPAGTMYLSATPPGSGHKALWSLTSKGAIRWTTQLDDDALLRSGAAGVLYGVRAKENGDVVWTPLATADGKPLAAAGRRESSKLEPLAGGLRLAATQVSEHEVRFSLRDQAGRIAHTWLVTSRTPVAFAWRSLTPVLVRGSLVVSLDVSRQTKRAFLWEHVVLRLGRSGLARAVTLDARALWDPDGTTAGTGVRVGLDGKLYELRTGPATGASVARYTLGA